MIIEPNVKDLLKNEDIDSRYTLVIATAKRAREIAEEEPKTEKTVKLAVRDIAEGKVHVIPAPEVPEVAQEDIVYKDYVEPAEEEDEDIAEQ